MSRWFETVFEVIGWIRLFLSPFLIGTFIGIMLLFNLPEGTGTVVCILLSLAGAGIGIVFANRTWKKTGTHFFLSRGSIDLDPPSENEKEKPAK